MGTQAFLIDCWDVNMTRKIIIDMLDNFAFAAVLYAVFASVVFLFTEIQLNAMHMVLILGIVMANYCLRLVSAKIKFKKPSSTVNETKKSVDVVGTAFRNEGMHFYVFKLALTHMIIPVMLIIFLPPTTQGILWIIFSVFTSIFSLGFGLGKKPETSLGFIILTAVFFIFFSLLMADAGNWGLVRVFPLVLVAVSVCRILVVHMTKMDNSLNSANSSSKQAVGNILKFNYKLLTGLTVTFVAIVAVLYLFLVAPLLDAVSNLAPESPAFQRMEFDEAFYSPPSEHMADEEFAEWSARLLTRETPWYATLILNIILGVIVVFVLSLIIYGIAITLLRWSRISAKVSSTAKNDSSQTEDIKEFILPRGRKKRVKLDGLHPVRRLFRETLTKHIKKGIPIQKTDTPTDMTHRIPTDDFGDLAKEYSQVRYGG